MKIRRGVLIPAPAKGGAVFRVETVYPWAESPALLQEWTVLEGSDTFGLSFRRFSPDGGLSWSDSKTIFLPRQTAAGVERTGESALFRHAATGRLFRFFNAHLYPEGAHSREVTQNTTIWWESSTDGGATFSESRQLIVEGGTPEAWAPGVRQGENSAMISFSVPVEDGGERIILPAHRYCAGQEGVGTYRLRMEAGCFLGEWTGNTLRWRAARFVSLGPECSSRGIFEPAIARLADGRFLMICRASNAGMEGVPGRKWVAVSQDALTWSEPRPLTDEAGEPFFSPSTGSRLIRYSRNGKLYWIGNLAAANPAGNRPRHPLHFAEVDERRLALRRDSIRVLDERREGEPEALQLSNFRAYEDRATGELAVTYARLLALGREAPPTPATQIRFIPE